MLRLGAAPALGVDDVLEAIGIEASSRERPEPPGDAGRVLAMLRDASATVDEIARAVALPVDQVAAVLVELELDGRVSSEEGVHRATMGM